MTQRNGIRRAGELCPNSETHEDHEQASGMEQEKAPDCEREDGGYRGSAAETAPDGGWGWVVLLATIMVLALTLAFPSCMGIFYTDLQNDFHASNSLTSWVPSIMLSVLHAGGKVHKLGLINWALFG